MSDEQLQNDKHKEDQLLYEKYLTTTSKQAGMVFGTRVIGYFLGFVMQAVFARFLGPDKYGVYSLGLTVANVGVLFGTFGLPTGMTKFLGEYIGNKKYDKAKGTLISGFKWTIILSSFAAVMISLFRKPIAIKIFKEERLIPLLPWFSIILVLLALIRLFDGILKGFKKPSVFTFYKEIIERSFRIVIFIVLFFLGVELLGVIIATFVSSIIVLVRLFLWLIKKGKIVTDKKIKPFPVLRTLLSYSSNMLFVSFTYFLMGQVNRLIIGSFLNSKQVGLYSISDTIAGLAVFFLVAFNAIIAPIISDVFYKRKIGIMSELYSNITRWITTFTLPIIIWIVIFSEEILTIFGTEYTIAKWTLITLAIGQFANAVTGSCGQILIMTKYQRYEMFNGLFMAILNVGLNILLIPSFGILGSAIAGAVAITAVNITKLIEVVILLKLFPYNKKFLKLLLPTGVSFFSMVFLNFYLKNITAALLGLFGSFIVFFLILPVTKLEPEDKLIIKAVINKIRNIMKRKFGYEDRKK